MSSSRRLLGGRHGARSGVESEAGTSRWVNGVTAGPTRGAPHSAADSLGTIVAVNGSATELPALHEFLISPGFIGAGVFFASIVGFVAVWYLTRQQASRLEATLTEQAGRWARQRHTDAVKRCWDRLAWLVDNAGEEPVVGTPEDARLGMGPELAFEVLSGLHAEAVELDDQTLIRATTVYLAQFGLVLSQQTAPLAAPAARAKSAGKPVRRDNGRVQGESSGEAPASEPSAPSDSASTSGSEPAETPTRRSRRR